jgi:hypothetical protein
MKTLALAMGICSTSAVYAVEGDDMVPEADMAKVTAALAELGCKDPDEVKEKEQGIYEIDDVKCKMGAAPQSHFRTLDIKLDKDFSVILSSPDTEPRSPNKHH